jgi:UDP-N-acetylglucosamine--N-acetylmuramyl-(pentapeptide) pyrophosphoryl-undecaprenol N-acetylglucosamine transferase
MSKFLMTGDKVLLMGGFASAPVAIAAAFKKVDIHIHEQNSVMGLVNKMMSLMARRVYTSYPHTKGAPGRSMFVGNPVRRELMHGRPKSAGRNILVLGGSGGSRKINLLIAQMAEALLQAGYKIHHQTGHKMFEETVNEYERYIDHTQAGLNIVPYIDDMAAAYAAADLVIARSGSGTVFEVTYARRPAIYIPFALATDNHQYYNAEAMRRKHYAQILEERELSAESLTAAIEDVFEHMGLYMDRLHEVLAMDSAELIVKQLLS